MQVLLDLVAVTRGAKLRPLTLLTVLAAEEVVCIDIVLWAPPGLLLAFFYLFVNMVRFIACLSETRQSTRRLAGRERVT